MPSQHITNYFYVKCLGFSISELRLYVTETLSPAPCIGRTER